MTKSLTGLCYLDAENDRSLFLIVTVADRPVNCFGDINALELDIPLEGLDGR